MNFRMFVSAIKNAIWLVRGQGMRGELAELRREITYTKEYVGNLDHRINGIVHAPDAFKLLLEQFPAVTEIVSTTDNGVFAMSMKDAIPRGVSRTIAETGNWEQDEMDVLSKHIRPGDLVIDIGANIGWHSVAMARKVGKDGIVVAFEPEPYNYSLLQRNLVMNGFTDRVECLKQAVADVETEVLFEKSDYNYGDHRVRYQEPIVNGGYYHEHNRQTMMVKAGTLDGTLSSPLISEKAAKKYQESGIRLLKMDTQGSEFKILKGADQALKKTDYLVLEFWPYGLKRAGDTADELLGLVFKYFDGASLIDTPAWRHTREDRQIVYDLAGLMKLKERITMADHFDLLFFKKPVH